MYHMMINECRTFTLYLWSAHLYTRQKKVDVAHGERQNTGKVETNIKVVGRLKTLHQCILQSNGLADKTFSLWFGSFPL